MDDLTNVDAARLSGVRINTTRFYEARGMLRAPPRRAGNRRLHDAAAVQRLRFIRHVRAPGFGLDDINALLALQGQPGLDRTAADSPARKQLLSVERRLTQSTVLRDELGRMTEACDGGAVARCRVIATLSDHALCRADHAVENSARMPQ